MTFFYAYFACFLLGFGFVLISALMSGLGGHGDHGADGGHDLGHGHDVEVGHDGEFAAGHGDADVGHGGGDAGPAEGQMHLPIFSPLVIACFLAAFGGSGMLYRQLFGDNPWLHAPLAAATSVALGFAIAFAIWKLTSTFNSARNARATDALGTMAEVSVTIPVEGVGEVAYVSGGTRQTISARSADGKEYKQGSSVKVHRLKDGVAFVGEPLGGIAAVVGVEESPAEPSRGEPIEPPEKVH
ncbi:MAG: hypothetical protein QM765_12830 [Myxococcales bacterium]